MGNNLTGYPSIDKPWLKYYSEEAINAPLPECTIYEYLMENNRDFPDDIALLYLGRKIKYGELFRRIDRTAAAFAALGVRPGEIVTVALPSIPEALYVVYALNKIGAVSNMIHPLAGEEEIIHYLNETNSRVAILFDQTYQIIKDSIYKTSLEKAVVITAGESLPISLKLLFKIKNGGLKLPSDILMSWNQFLQIGKGGQVKTVKKDAHAVAIISHTGGTTGEPKGCMLSDYNFNSEVVQIVTTIHYERQESFLAVLPPFVNYSLVHSMIGAINSGLISVLIPKYEPGKLVEYIHKYRINHINSIPAYCEALLQIPNIDKYKFPYFGFMFYGGEAMANETEQQINSVLEKCGFKHKLQKGLGMTELTGAATKTMDETNELGSVGIPMPKMNCKIVNVNTNTELKYGEEGEVCISGPTLMLGYYHNKAATNEVIRVHSDGIRWIHTGDLGYISEDGVLFLTGRIKRILMTKGKDGNVTKIFPDRIEAVLNQHPAVELCCVVGIPDEERINYPKAFVVTKAGVAGDEALTEELLRICRDQLPGYMVPDEIEYRSDLPRTPRGKIDYRELERENRA